MAKLPTGRYVIVEHDDEFCRGGLVNSMQLKAELEDGIYPKGTIVEHVLSGRCFRVDITPRIAPFGTLTARQQNRADRYRADAWPNPQQRPLPRLRK